MLLGNSEVALGKRDDALASLGQGAGFEPVFWQGRRRQGLSHGRRAAFIHRPNRYCSRHLADPRLSGRYELELALIRVYRYQGRFHDIRPLMRASWCRAPQPALVLKELWGFDMAPKPVELLKKSLSTADKNDDRVWLGWANHAILTGQFAEARSWLERCLSRRPDDHGGMAGPARAGAGNRRR